MVYGFMFIKITCGWSDFRSIVVGGYSHVQSFYNSTSASRLQGLLYRRFTTYLCR